MKGSLNKPLKLLEKSFYRPEKIWKIQNLQNFEKYVLRKVKKFDSFGNFDKI